LNEQSLRDKVSKIEKLAQEVDFSDIGNAWVPYGTKFNIYYDLYLRKVYAWNRM
jgi:hypothetical protein